MGINGVKHIIKDLLLNLNDDLTIKTSAGHEIFISFDAEGRLFICNERANKAVEVDWEGFKESD